MRKLFRSSNIVVALGASILLAACSASGTVSGSYGGSSDESAVKELVRNVGDRVFFATDSAALSAEARSTIMRQADWLKTNSKSLTIEGHADERGTREYNIALGARRKAGSVDRDESAAHVHLLVCLLGGIVENFA